MMSGDLMASGSDDPKILEAVARSYMTSGSSIVDYDMLKDPIARVAGESGEKADLARNRVFALDDATREIARRVRECILRVRALKRQSSPDKALIRKWKGVQNAYVRALQSSTQKGGVFSCFLSMNTTMNLFRVDGENRRQLAEKRREVDHCRRMVRQFIDDVKAADKAYRKLLPRPKKASPPAMTPARAASLMRPAPGSSRTRSSRSSAPSAGTRGARGTRTRARR